MYHESPDPCHLCGRFNGRGPEDFDCPGSRPVLCPIRAIANHLLAKYYVFSFQGYYNDNFPLSLLVVELNC